MVEEKPVRSAVKRESGLKAFFALAVIIGLVIAALAQLLPLRNPYDRSDLFAYITAEDLVSQGLNPYDPTTVLAAWRARWGVGNTSVLMIWNPPTLFLFPGLLLKFPESLLYALWPIVTVLSAALLAFIGWKLSSCATLRVVPLVVGTLCSPAIIWEIQTSQLSSLLAVAPLMGILLFMRGRDVSAGLLISLAILKPHTVFLPLVTIGFWTLFNRRWGVVVGGIVGATLGGALAEAAFPGITAQWISRDSWPINVSGSTLSSMIREISITRGYPDPSYVSVLMPLLGITGVGLALFTKARTPASIPLMWSLLLNQFFSPYGFVIDQAPLIVVQAFLVSQASSQSKVAKTLVLLMAASLLPSLISEIPSDHLSSPWWFVYPPTLVAIFLLTRERRTCG